MTSRFLINVNGEQKGDGWELQRIPDEWERGLPFWTPSFQRIVNKTENYFRLNLNFAMLQLLTKTFQDKKDSTHVGTSIVQKLCFISLIILHNFVITGSLLIVVLWLSRAN